MTLHVENKVRILPFTIDIDWRELVSVWSEEELSFKRSKFYYIKMKNGDSVVISEGFELPVFIDGVIKKIEVSKFFAEKSKYLSKSKVELLKYVSGKGMDIHIKSNKIIHNLLQDFEFSFEEVEDINLYLEEVGVKIYDMIKKIILIDNYLFFVKNEKNKSLVKEDKYETVKDDCESLSKSELSDKLFLLKEGISLIKDKELRDSLNNIVEGIK